MPKTYEQLGSLKYPSDMSTTQNDYIQFAHYKYTNNDNVNKDQGGRYEGMIIKLYMPNSTPDVQQLQSWGGQKFQGDIGQMTKQAMQTAGRMVGQGGQPGVFGGSPTGAATQGFINFAAAQSKQDPNHILQLSGGKVFNPNIEMMYSSPMHRGFTFTFNFIPKSKSDSVSIDRIIREFKYWSSPGIDGTSYLTIPDIWNIKYYEGGKGAAMSRMNKFKPCVLEGVVVRDNPISDYHMTIKDSAGAVPVHTTMSLTFKETDIVTRKDHDNSAGEYKRGM